MQRRTLSRWLLPLFFIVVLAVGFVTVPQYGRPWDERLEMDILRMNLWEYARAVGAEATAVTRKLRTRQFNRRYHIEPTLTYNSPPLSIIH